MNIIYLRTSTEDQNPENQLKDCMSIIPKEETVETIEEKQSAWKDKLRPKFEEIRIRIKKREVKNLYVWDLDRIYRNRKKLIEFFKFCKLYNCKIHSFRQQFFESINEMPPPFDEAIYDLMLQIMGWLAEDESKKKSDRVKAAVRRKGKRTVSYKGKKWGRKSLSKQVVKSILLLGSKGKSIREISKKVYYWDRSNNKKNVSKSAVHKVLAENKGEKIVNEVVQ